MFAFLSVLPKLKSVIPTEGLEKVHNNLLV